MTFFQAVILGIVEGITEFLPVSSTGHLILAGRLFGIEDSNFTRSFEIAIQLGAILAVVVLYWKKIISDRELWKKGLAAFLPTAVVGFLLYGVIKEIFLSSAVLVVWSLLLGGIALIAFELWLKKQGKAGSNSITYKQSFFIGLVQSLSSIPGVSRSAATIIGGMLAGISREKIVEFSFLLAVPTMAAATGYDLLKSGAEFSFDQLHVLAVGFMVSFLVAGISIALLLNFVKRHTFIPFGVYRIAIALIFWFLVLK